MSSIPTRSRSFPPRIGRLGQSLWRNFRAVGFWTAVALPATYPLVLVSGVPATRARTILFGLLWLHLLALIAGRSHARQGGRG